MNISIYFFKMTLNKFAEFIKYDSIINIYVV